MLRLQMLVDFINLARLLLLKIFIRQDKNTWLISERGHEAKDNGYFFFLWLVKNYPEVNIKYIISADSKDLHKFNGYEKCIVYWNSWMHYYYLCKSHYLISTHILGFRPNITTMYELDQKINIFKSHIKVFLQHGIIQNDLKGLYADKQHLDLFICGSKVEYDYVLQNFGYNSDVVKYTGLCRFDRLHNSISKKQILLMPTWRKYIDRNKFESSVYYKAFASFLVSDKLKEVLQKFGYELVFYPHYEFQEKIHLFKKLPVCEYVHIADLGFDVQNLMKESEFMITDFSSVAFDMLYMHKPVIYYQFDKEMYFSKHYDKGYLSHESVGPVCLNEQELLQAINRTLLNNGKMDNKYENYINHFYLLYDDKNCLRVFNEIMALCKK